MIGAEFAATLARAQAGDPDAVARLYRDAQPGLLRYLRVIVPEAADDAAAETWLQVVTGLDRFSGAEMEFRGWLFAIARHRAADVGRYRSRHPTVPLAHGDADKRLTAPDTADVAAERAATQRALTLIAKLPKDQAEIVMLRVMAGLDTNTVARIVGKKPGAVRVAAHRALRRLAAMIDRAGVL